ncbi:MAG: TolC family protein [Saprospiraceae bacterium]|nr:TolC family protein [Saprospiraceae bacterium]
MTRTLITIFINTFRIQTTACLLFISFWIQAQPILTLDDAIKIGVQNNFQIQILQSNEQIAINNNNPANADFLPRVSTTGSYSLSNNNTQQEFFNGDSRSASGAGSRNARAAVDANWTIFDGFRREAIKEELQLDERRATEITQAEVLALIEQIQLAYFELGQLQKEMALTVNSIELNQAILTLALQKQRIGTASEAEVLQARSQLNIDSIQLIRQQGQLTGSEIAFNQLLNQPLSTTISVSDEISLETLPNQAAMVEEAKSKNPQLVLARLDQLTTAMQIKSVKSVLYPKLNLGASYVYNFSKAEVGFLLSNQTYGPSTQLTLTYDIYSGRNLKKELQNIELVQGNLLKDQRRIEWEIESRIVNLYNDYANLAVLQDAEDRQILIAEKNTLLANELYRYGRNTSFEVREAVLREIQAKNRLIQNEYQMKYIEIQLKAIAGMLR